MAFHQLDDLDAAHIAEIDQLFIDPLHVGDVKLPGVVQAVDFHMLRHRVQRAFESRRFTALQYLAFFICTVVMLMSPVGQKDTWNSAAEGVILICLVLAVAELCVYVLAYGFLPTRTSSKSSIEVQRVMAIFAVWSPPRLRQSTAVQQLRKNSAQSNADDRRPLLSSPGRIVEVLLLGLSIAGYCIPTDASPFSQLRYLHGLRCIKLMAAFGHFDPTIAHLLAALKHSVPMLITASTFFAFFFVVFGVLGVDPFKGEMSFVCVTVDIKRHPTFNITQVDTNDICTDRSNLTCVESVPTMYCDATATKRSFYSPGVCRLPLVCRETLSPNLGYSNFDNIAYAWLTMLQITSLSRWSDLLYSLWSNNPRIAAGGYCFALIVVVTFIMMNLVTAIINSSFSKTRQSDKRTKRAAAQRNVLAVELERFTHWSFPSSIVHHLTHERLAKDGTGRIERVPFFKDIRYAIVADLLLVALVGINAANDVKRHDGYREFIRGVEVAYVVLFSLEVILSIVACGSIHNYAKSKVCIFDFLCLLLAFFGFTVKLNLSCVRSIRFLRWAGKFKLIRGVLARVQKILQPSIGIAVLLGLYVVVFAAVSVKMFSREFTGPADESEVNSQSTFFNDETISLRTVFRSVTIDQWETPMYVIMSQFHWIIGTFYFIPVYFLFGYVLTSLFVAVIIDSFDPTREEKITVQRKQLEFEMTGQSRTNGRAMIASVLDTFDFEADAMAGDPAEAQLLLADQSAHARQKPDDLTVVEALDDAVNDADDLKVQRFRTAVLDISLGCFTLHNKVRQVLIKMVVDIDSLEARLHMRRVAWQKKHKRNYGVVESGDKAGEMRVKANEAEPPKTYGAWFAWFIMLFIALSCVQVFTDPPAHACSAQDRDQPAWQERLFMASDVILAIIFTLEAVFKIIAHGALFDGDDRPWYLSSPYFRDGWNFLDFLLLVLMYVGFFVPQARPLRILRTLRPLRVVRRVRHMRHMITGLLSSMPSIFIVFLLAMYVIFVCAVVGVNMFSGKMNYCTSNDIGGVEVKGFSDCRGVSFNKFGVVTPNAWRRPASHFDHVGGAMIFITEIASLSEWSERMRQVIDVVGVDRQPQVNYNARYSAFFVLLVVALSLVTTKIIVGVLMYHFDAHRAVLLLTDSQKDWVSLRNEIRALHPIAPPPKTPFRRLQPFVSHWIFDAAVNAAVFLNIVLLSSSHNKQSDAWSEVQFWGNIFFLCFFFVEFFLKLAAMGVAYFKDTWNLLDFAVLLGSLIELTIESASGTQGSAIVTVGRTFRILRVFRSVKRITNLRNVFHTLALSFFSILSVTMFIIIVLFIFGAIGRNIFGNIRNLEHANNNANFRDLDVVFFLMFRLLTLDRWAAIMNDLRQYYPPFCNQYQEGWSVIDPDTNEWVQCGMLNDCSTEASQIFFILFYAIAGYLVLSVMIAMLLENFKFIATQTRVPVKMRDFDSYQQSWLRARRPLGVLLNYDSHIEPRLLSSFIIDLFNHRNALVVNKEGVTIHPCLSAQSRLNFRKLKFELDALGRHKKLPPNERYTFHAILLVCTRMQLGVDVLTAKQREDRVYFDMACTLAISGERLKRLAVPLLAAARQRIAARKAETVFSFVLEREEGESGSDDGVSASNSPNGTFARTPGEGLKKKSSRVGFHFNDGRGSSGSRSATPGTSTTLEPPRGPPLATAPPLIASLPPATKGPSPESEPAEPSPQSPTRQPSQVQLPPHGPPEVEALPSHQNSPLADVAMIHLTSAASVLIDLQVERATGSDVSDSQSPDHGEASLSIRHTPSHRSAETPGNVSRHQSVSQAELRAALANRPQAAAVTQADEKRNDSRVPITHPEPRQPPSLPSPHPPTASVPLASPVAAVPFAVSAMALSRHEADKRYQRQKDFVTKVWGATRRFVETVEEGVRSKIVGEWRDLLWHYNALPRRRYTVGSPVNTARPFDTSQREPFSSSQLLLDSGFSSRRAETARLQGPERILFPSAMNWRDALAASSSLTRPLGADLEASVEMRAMGVTNPILSSQITRLPICFEDRHCRAYSDPQHARSFRHTCRSGDQCLFINDTEHRYQYDHNSAVVSRRHASASQMFLHVREE
jgi:hypothetical protein